MDYTATLDRCLTTEQVISAGSWHFGGGAARIAALLAEYGYAATGRIHWERIGDDSMSLALVPAYEYLTGTEVTVAVLGHEAYRTTYPQASAGVGVAA
jgi:hypothetical protein